MIRNALRKVIEYASVGPRRQKEDIVVDDARVARPTGDVLNEYELSGNVPNPFSSMTTIVFVLPETARVRLSVHDLMGRRMAVLVDERLSAGKHEKPFHPTNLPKGQYLCRLSTPKGEFSRLMMYQ